jgi:flagellar basal body rod protein FlgG
VFDFEDQKKLIKAGNALYKLEEGEDRPMEQFRVVQGNLETSNVNMMEEMTAMIAAQRSFEAHTKMMESYSKLSERQDELGSVG